MHVLFNQYGLVVVGRRTSERLEAGEAIGPGGKRVQVLQPTQA